LHFLSPAVVQVGVQVATHTPAPEQVWPVGQLAVAPHLRQPLVVAQVLNPAVPSHCLAPLVHSLVQVVEQIPAPKHVFPVPQATALPHFRQPPDNAQVCTPLPLHCLALAVVQVGVQVVVAAHTPAPEQV
jgi:hypothetical protein